jgi:ribonuclease J
VLRIIPLGGVEEIGKNMTAIEYGGDIVIIDAGFQFPGDEAPGVDYIIPDTTYLTERAHKVRGLIITHGHLDHIGGIPYITERIGNPPLYARKLTAALIKKRQDEFPHLPQLDMRLIEKEESVTLGTLKVRFFAVTHTIPDAMGVIIETPLGNIVHTGDLKVDHDKGVPLASEEETFGAVGASNNLVLMSDSTNVERPGFSYSERAVHENLRELIKGARGRLIIGTFASLLERIIFIVKTAEELNKKIVLEGRSMKINVEIAKELGYLKAGKHVIIPSEEMDNYPTKDIIILATGAQGDAYAALMRMANRQHKTVKINKTDVVILSSSVIPGNEKTVQKLKDNLSRQGAKILHQAIADVHSSGHAYREEAAWIIKKINPRFFIPVHGYHYMLRVHGEVAQSVGLPEENVIIPDNGMIIEINPDGTKITPAKETAPAGIVMIDGLGRGDVKEVVVRDRQVLAQDGMFVIVAVIDIKTGKIRKSPDIISRGFVYLKESQDLLNQTRLIVKKAVEDSVGDMHPINFDYIKNSVRERVGKFLFQETSKRPIIIPVLLEV